MSKRMRTVLGYAIPKYKASQRTIRRWIARCDSKTEAKEKKLNG